MNNILADLHVIKGTLIGSRSIVFRPTSPDNFLVQQIISDVIADTTDWDYVAEYSENKINYLKRNGYDVAENPNHKIIKESNTDDIEYYIEPAYAFDKITTHIAKKQFGNTEIQFIFKDNSKEFIKLWDGISSNFYYQYIWKRGPSYLGKDSKSVRDEIMAIINQLIETKGL